MTTMTYRGVRYRCGIKNGTVCVEKIKDHNNVFAEEELLGAFGGDDDINDCIIDNLDPDSIPWDEIFDQDKE